MAFLRAIRYVLLTVAILAPVAACRGDPLQTAGEQDLKAAYLFNIAKFVEWPAKAFATTGGSLVVGVLGDAELAATIEAKLVGKSVQGRPIAVRSFASPAAVGPCQILFVSPARTGSVRQILARLAGFPILVIGQHDRLLGAGGIINFFIEDDTIRFEINPVSAEQRGLRISSKLLRLARIVR